MLADHEECSVAVSAADASEVEALLSLLTAKPWILWKVLGLEEVQVAD